MSQMLKCIFCNWRNNYSHENVFRSSFQHLKVVVRQNWKINHPYFLNFLCTIWHIILKSPCCHLIYFCGQCNNGLGAWNLNLGWFICVWSYRCNFPSRNIVLVCLVFRSSWPSPVPWLLNGHHMELVPLSKNKVKTAGLAQSEWFFF